MTANANAGQPEVANAMRHHDEASPRDGLLHNMSAPPKSVVRYEGLAGWKSEVSTIPASSRSGTLPLAVVVGFALPRNVKGSSASALLRSMGITPKRDPQRQLDALINARASELPLPPGCAVLSWDESHRVIWTDLLSTLAVLSKCSHTLWLRDKNPSVTSALQRQSASLLVPPLFVSRLPKESS